MLSSFPPKCQATLANYRITVARHADRPTNAKALTTTKSRQVRYLNFCSRMDIPDPCLPNHHPQQRKYFVACFIISIFQGESINGIPIKVNTAKSYLPEVDALLNARQIRSPQCADVNLIKKLLDAQLSWESQPNRCNPIAVKKFRYASARLRYYDPDSAKAAICNWLSLGRHTGYRK